MVTHSQIVEMIADKTGYDLRDVAIVLKAFNEIVTELISSRMDEVAFLGIGRVVFHPLKNVKYYDTTGSKTVVLSSKKNPTRIAFKFSEKVRNPRRYAQQKAAVERFNARAMKLDNKTKRAVRPIERTLLDDDEAEIYKHGINIDWIKTGQGSMIAAPASQSTPIAESTPPYQIPAKSYTPDDLLQITASVLSSDTIYRDALVSNVKAFADAVTMRQELQVTKAVLAGCRSEIEILKDKMKSMEERLLSAEEKKLSG